MKNSTKYISLVFAAGAAGLAFFAFANASFTAALHGDMGIAIATSASLLGFAIYDYSRRPKSLSLSAQVPPPAMLRPAPASGHVCSARANHEHCIAA
jgi:hypothetical protein